MAGKGWICLHRGIQNHWIWDDPEKLRAWIDLLMLANYEDKKAVCKGKLVDCKRGAVNLSISYLAERWKWDRRAVKKFLLLLESDGMCTLKCTRQCTTINIVNYSTYQDISTFDVQRNVQQDEQQNVQRMYITNKYNNKTNKQYKAQSNKFVNFNQRTDYNMDEIEKALLEE